MGEKDGFSIGWYGVCFRVVTMFCVVLMKVVLSILLNTSTKNTYTGECLMESWRLKSCLRLETCESKVTPKKIVLLVLSFPRRTCFHSTMDDDGPTNITNTNSNHKKGIAT